MKKITSFIAGLLLGLAALSPVYGATTTAAASPFTGSCVAGSACSGTTITATTGFVAPAGSQSAPGISIGPNANDGIFNAGSQFNLTIGGSEIFAAYAGTAWVKSNAAAAGYFIGNAADVGLTRYAAKQLMISGNGTGATTNAGLILGYSGSSGIGAIWSSAVTPSTANHVLQAGATSTQLNVASGGLVAFGYAGTDFASFRPGSGGGLYVSANTFGSATTDVQAISATQTWNNAGVTFTAFKQNITDTASNASSLLMDLQVGGSSKFKVGKDGSVTTPGAVIASGIIYAGLDSTSGVQFGTAGNTTNLSYISAGVIGVGTGAAGSFAGGLKLTDLTINRAASFLTTSVALTNGAGAGAGTLLNAPAAGNPTKWIGINDNGTVRYIPAW